MPDFEFISNPFSDLNTLDGSRKYITAVSRKDTPSQGNTSTIGKNSGGEWYVEKTKEECHIC